MPSAEELEQLLEPSLVGFIRNEADEHGWTEDEYERMLRMEHCKERGLEDGNR